jgi:hypothetical protein
MLIFLLSCFFSMPWRHTVWWFVAAAPPLLSLCAASIFATELRGVILLHELHGVGLLHELHNVGFHELRIDF